MTLAPRIPLVRNPALALALILGFATTVVAPPARASDLVTYEVDSDSIPQANVEYVDGSGRRLIESVPLPWRLDVTLDNARGPTGRGGAQVRADWRPFKSKWRMVTVRIYDGGELLCQSTLDVGDVTCYGNTPFMG